MDKTSWTYRMTTVYPRSLDPFYKATKYMKWAKTSWTWSIPECERFPSWWLVGLVRSGPLGCRVVSEATIHRLIRPCSFLPGPRLRTPDGSSDLPAHVWGKSDFY